MVACALCYSCSPVAVRSRSAITGDEALDRRPVCKAGDPRVDAAVFAKLTANQWGTCGSNNGLCLTLSAGGDYTTVEGFDDYSIDGGGRWNFLARTATSGLVCFDDGTITDFELTADGLRWNTHGLLPVRDSIAQFGSRDALDTMGAPALFATLTHNEWARQNDLNLFYLPTSFTMRRNGTWDGDWRGGDCHGTGTFSIVNRPTQLGSTEQALWAHAAPNTCDTRNRGITASLPDTDEYADPARVGDGQFLMFSSYGEGYGLRVRASWQSRLQSDSTKQWSFALTNQSSREQTISALEITLTPIEATTDGYTAIGPAQTLVSQPLAQSVAGNGTVELTATLALPAAGVYSMLVNVTSADERQPYQNREGYVVELSP